MAVETLHAIKHGGAATAKQPSESGGGGGGATTTWRSIDDLPFEAQEALYAVRGVGAGKKKGEDGKKKGEDGKKKGEDGEKKGDGADTIPPATGPDTFVTGGVSLYDNAQGSGSATIVTTIPAASEMYDAGAPSKRFIKLLKDKPQEEPWVLWAEAVGRDPNVGGEVGVVRGKAKAEDGGGKQRYALIVGNGKYPPKRLSDLPKAQPDAAALASTYQGLDGGRWKVNHLENMPAAPLEKLLAYYRDNAQPGDEVFISVHGHGSRFGFLGVDGQPVPWTLFAELASTAVSGGWDCTIVAESCHSGRIQHYVGKEPGNDLKAEMAVTLEHGQGESASALIASDELHTKNIGKGYSNDYATKVVERLEEQLQFGNDAQIYGQLESVEQIFLKYATREKAPPVWRITSLTEARKALVRLRGHERLAEPELKALFERCQVAAYKLKKRIERDRGGR